jgi:uncharacterized protein (UPF0333 family)
VWGQQSGRVSTDVLKNKAVVLESQNTEATSVYLKSKAANRLLKIQTQISKKNLPSLDDVILSFGVDKCRLVSTCQRFGDIYFFLFRDSQSLVCT